MNYKTMKREVLTERLEELGWTNYKLAAEFDRVKGEGKGAANYTSAVARALDNPDAARIKTIEDLVVAMGGEIVVRWKQTEEVVSGYREVNLSD